MDFGEVLTKAWKIIWKYKVLWLFGIFASCSGGGGGGGGGSSANYSNNLPPEVYHTMNNIDPWLIGLIVVGLIILGILVTILVLVVSTIGRIGLIQGAALADRDENAQITFGGLIKSMKPFFWRILGLNILIAIASFILIVGLIFIGFFGTIITLGLALICLIPLCCLLVPVSWLLVTFVEMANVAVVVEDLSIVDGIQRGWQVFKANLGTMVLMGLILVIGSIFVSILIALPVILTLIPFSIALFASISGNTEALAATGVILSGLCCLAYFPVLIVVSGILRAYINSAWTLTFLRLTGKPGDQSQLEIRPDEPESAVTMPETLEAPAIEAETLTTPGPEEPAPPEDLLPKDF